MDMDIDMEMFINTKVDILVHVQDYVYLIVHIYIQYP
jgi:hypothetical protein